MKKKKSLLILPILILFGCSTKTISETFQNKSINGASSIKIIVKRKDNKIENLKYEIVNPYSKLLVSTKEEAKEVMEDILNSYNSIDGVKATAECKNSTVIQNIEVKVDQNSTLSDNALFKDIDFNDFNTYKNALLDNGFKKN